VNDPAGIRLRAPIHHLTCPSSDLPIKLLKVPIFRNFQDYACITGQTSQPALDRVFGFVCP
jgi:hypothetical protein